MSRNHHYITSALMGACLFWGAYLGIVSDDKPHPGLSDDELKEALREDWSHEKLGYWEARSTLFGEIDGNGRKTVGRYTGEPIRYFRQPLPNTGMLEHAWELTRLPARARTDLHHLFPVLPEANAARLNFHYGDVYIAVWSRGGSRSGPSTSVRPVFEVRNSFRGNVARSMFYVSTMYDRPIPDDEEQILKEWHTEDPVDAEERRRNAKVAEAQTSRNPFIDHPGLVDRIRDF